MHGMFGRRNGARAPGCGIGFARRAILRLSLLIPLVLAQPVGAQQPGASAAVSTASASIWFQQEQARFGALVAKRAVDLLIVPFQVNGRGLDPVERTLMAGALADHLAANTGLSIADPVLVGRALGEGFRTYDERDILSLADSVHAKSVLIGTAGHDGQRKMAIRIKLMRRNTGGEWQNAGEKVWNTLPLKDDAPPYRTFSAVFPDVMQQLNVPSVRQPQVAVLLSPPGALPSLRAVYGQSKTVNVHVAQLLASLYPRFPEPPHERAWAQTLRIAHLAPAGADNRLAVARALMHLGRRPAALSALDTPRTSAERALLEALNGNLPAAAAQAVKIQDPVLRLIAQIELRDLRLKYDAATPQIEVSQLSNLIPEDSEWYPFLHVRLHGEGSAWGVESVFNAVDRFGALLGESPTPEPALANMLEKAEDWSAVELALARRAFATYDKLVRAERPGHAMITALTRSLLLDLYQAQVAADLLAQIYMTMDTRADTDGGNRVLAELEPLLRGHPDFYAAMARLAWRESARWRGKQRDQWLQRALANSRNAYRFSNRLSKALEFTERNAPYTPDTAAALDAVRKEYFRDWPVCLTWVPSALRQDRVAMEQYADDVVTYATSEYSTIDWLLGMPAAASRQELLRKSIQGRFSGHPGLAQDRAALLLANFRMKDAEQPLRDYIAARPMGIGPYWSLAELLIAQGRHREASEMLLGYPGFEKDSGADRVGLSNYAGGIAWMWWPIGQLEYAKPFFERSAGYKTGSGYSLQSAALLSLDDGDPDTAAKLYMDIARRYSSLERLSDYFDLIFALGRPEEAWRTYDETYRDGNAGRVLASITNGVRVLGWTDSQTIQWLSNEKNAALADGTYFYAPRAALAASIMDRELPVDLPGVLGKFSAPSPYELDRKRRKVLRRSAAGIIAPASPQVCGPSRYGVESAEGFQIPERIDSHLVYFATGYQALDQARYADAFNAFDTAARLFEPYGTGCESVAYMLPYLALAAGKVKNTRALDEYLQTVPYRYREFNYQLALATLSALRAQHDRASGYFEAALNRWSGQDGALPPAYIYADVLERLYKDTQAEVYRERLVHWAKIRQRVAPSSGWAYAKEYRYARNAADQRRALGMALYLDRQSASLRGIKPAEAAAARADLTPRNPFLAWRRAAK